MWANLLSAHRADAVRENARMVNAVDSTSERRPHRATDLEATTGSSAPCEACLDRPRADRPETDGSRVDRPTADRDLSCFRGTLAARSSKPQIVMLPDKGCWQALKRAVRGVVHRSPVTGRTRPLAATVAPASRFRPASRSVPATGRTCPAWHRGSCRMFAARPAEA